MSSLPRWCRLVCGMFVLGSTGCLPLDQELEVLLAPEAVGNILLFRDSAVFAVLQQLLF